MSQPLFPYQLRIRLPQAHADMLAAQAAEQHMPITALIRRYIADGLRRDAVAPVAPTPMPGQTTIPDGSSA